MIEGDFQKTGPARIWGVGLPEPRFLPSSPSPETSVIGTLSQTRMHIGSWWQQRHVGRGGRQASGTGKPDAPLPCHLVGSPDDLFLPPGGSSREEAPRPAGRSAKLLLVWRGEELFLCAYSFLMQPSGPAT